MVKLSNKKHEQQQERRLAKLEKEQMGMIEDWINQKNEWDRLKRELKIKSKSKSKTP